MRPQGDATSEASSGQPVPLEYAPHPNRRGWKYWVSRFLSRLSTPMPLAMYYLITLVLSIIALVVAVVIRLIVRAFE